MTGYTKLYNSILASTIWDEDAATRITWITMLAMSGPDGTVEGSIPGLAHQARLSIAETEAALEKLKAPDPHSRSKEFDGRRIREIDGGWLIINRLKYRDKINGDERREYRAKWMRDKRAAEREQGVNSREQSEQTCTQQSIAEHREAKSKARACASAHTPTLAEVVDYCNERNKGVDPQQWFDHYSANGWKVGRVPMKDWKAAVRTWERNGVNHEDGKPIKVVGNALDNHRALLKDAPQ
jgi:hypothetical protein